MKLEQLQTYPQRSDSDKEVVKAMFAVEEKHKKALKEAKKESAEDTKAKFQYAHFICVRSGAVIPWQL